MIELVRADQKSGEFLELVALLDAELRVRDGDDHDFYAQFNKTVGLAGVVVAMDEDIAVGCGAFRKYDDTTAEIKRMYVRDEYRGKRIATDILAELERWASESGFTQCILETGQKQPEAIALYRREGYEQIENYGQYADVYNSVCMKKILVSLPLDLSGKN